MASPIKISAANASDAPAIAALLNELNREEGYDITHTPEAISAMLFSPAAEVKLHAQVAWVAAHPVGVILYYAGYDTLSGSTGYHLADIVVTHTHRKHGVGKALMQALAAHALAEDKAWLSLTVLSRNANARAFYQALGMTQVEVDFFAMGKVAMTQLYVA